MPDLNNERKTAIRNAIKARVQIWLNNPDSDDVADTLWNNEIFDDGQAEAADVSDVDHKYAMSLFSKITFTMGDD